MRIISSAMIRMLRRWLIPDLKALDNVSSKTKNMLGFTSDGTIVTDHLLGPMRKYRYDMRSCIGTMLFKNGSFEKQEIDFFYKIIQRVSNPVVFDIGANVGWHSIQWASKIIHSKFYSFEPSPEVFSLFSDNVLQSECKNILPLQKAVSDKCDVLRFNVCQDNAYSSLKDTSRSVVKEIVNVEVVSIDEFVKTNKLSRLDFIKIDVEGFEESVLKGAEQVLKKMKPELFVEIYKGVNSNVNPEKTIQYVVNLGYAPYVFVNGKLKEFERHDDGLYNYYFKPIKDLMGRKY